MRKVRELIAFILILVLASSCATKTLWQSTSAGYYVRMRADLITEEEIKNKGLSYFKSNDGKSYYVQKTNTDRLRDYTLRLFGTPVAVVLDAATTILVIGTLGIIAAEVTSHGGDMNALSTRPSPTDEN